MTDSASGALIAVGTEIEAFGSTWTFGAVANGYAPVLKDGTQVAANSDLLYWANGALYSRGLYGDWSSWSTAKAAFVATASPFATAPASSGGSTPAPSPGGGSTTPTAPTDAGTLSDPTAVGPTDVPKPTP